MQRLLHRTSSNKVSFSYIRAIYRCPAIDHYIPIKVVSQGSYPVPAALLQTEWLPKEATSKHLAYPGYTKPWCYLFADLPYCIKRAHSQPAASCPLLQWGISDRSLLGLNINTPYLPCRLLLPLSNLKSKVHIAMPYTSNGLVLSQSLPVSLNYTNNELKNMSCSKPKIMGKSKKCARRTNSYWNRKQIIPV